MKLDSLDLGPTFEGILAHITSISALLHTTEGNIRAQHGPRVNGHLSRFQGLGNTMRTVDIICEDSSTQSVGRIIGLGDDLGLTRKFGNALLNEGSA